MNDFGAALFCVCVLCVVFLFGALNGQAGITKECENFNAFTSRGVKYTCEKVGK